MKSCLITAVAAFLTLFLAVSAQGVLLNDYTTLDVPEATHTHALGIDGSNIVGYYFDDINGANGLIYDGANYTTLEVPGSIRTYAHGIDGTNIVGWYRDANGDTHGFLATIPEPATLSLLMLGGLMFLPRRR